MSPKLLNNPYFWFDTPYNKGANEPKVLLLNLNAKVRLFSVQNQIYRQVFETSLNSCAIPPPPLSKNSKPPLSPAKIKRFFSLRKLLKKI